MLKMKDLALRVRVSEFEKYCMCREPPISLEGVQEGIAGFADIPPGALRGSDLFFFHRVCDNENVKLEMIECLLRAFPEAARTSMRCGSSPLHCVCGPGICELIPGANQNMDPRIVQLLLDAWPESVHHQNEIGETPLTLLCRHIKADETAQLDILELLLNAAPDSVTTVDSEGDLPIHRASRSGKPLSFFKRLIDAYPESPRVRTGNGLLPIHLACYGGDIKTVKCLIEHYPESIDARDRNGNLPIHDAAISFKTDSKVDVIRYLLSKDPDCASKTNVHQNLPLHSACRRKCLDSVRLLFDAYPEAITIQDGYGDTPVEIARGEYDYDAAIQFLEEQLDCASLAEDSRGMRTANENGWLPLHLELRNGASLGAIKLLIKGNPSALRVAVNQLAFPLHIACEFSTVGVVEHILGLLDIHLHTLDLQSKSTLHYACRGGNVGVAKCLLDRGVPSVTEPNSDGKLPIHLLWESDRVDRDSLEYVEANWLLLLAHPETVTH